MNILMLSSSGGRIDRLRSLLESNILPSWRLTTTGLESGEALSMPSPDLVFLDLAEARDALGHVLRLRNRLARAALVVLSTPETESLAREAVAHGAQDYCVLDALSPEALARVARNAVDRHRIASAALAQEREVAHERKLQAVGQLASGIAHEINTPTQYVSDNVRFLQRGVTTLLAVAEEVERALPAWSGDGAERLRSLMAQADIAYLAEEMPAALEQSLEGLNRIARIVSAMREFSHPASTSQEPADINAALRSTALVASSEWKYVAELHLQLDPHLPQVTCFIGDLNQVFLNLIVNAAHAIADARRDPGALGSIDVTTSSLGDWVEIRISDTGTGIPERHRHRLFEAFFTTKDLGKGTGQGLAIAYDVVVNKHGGEIRCESEEGQGATFIVRLPVAGKAAAAPVESLSGTA
jgi:signal transduction histidine kinase